jgi:hypothetical protein
MPWTPICWHRWVDPIKIRRIERMIGKRGVRTIDAFGWRYRCLDCDEVLFKETSIISDTVKWWSTKLKNAQSNSHDSDSSQQNERLRKKVNE